MEVVRCYMDLCKEIEKYEDRLESLIGQKESMMERWMKPLSDLSGVDYTRPKVQGGKQRMDMEEELVHLAEAEEGIEKYQALLRKLKECRDRIKESIDGTTDIAYKIAFKKLVEDKSLLVISEELNYSYNYIRNISSKRLGKKRVG
jgi:predicted transcriptional regulator